MSRHRIAVALLVAQPLAAELDGFRQTLGAAERALVPPHLTLVSPINLRDEALDEALDLVRRSAAATPALRLLLGPATTFLPVTPTVHLAVGGHGLESLLGLRALLVGSAPLDRPDDHDFVPHVTLAQELQPPERIAAALEPFAAWRAEVRFDRVHVLRQGDDRVWAPIADWRLVGSKVD